MIDILVGASAILGVIIGALVSHAGARCAYLALTVSSIRKERIAEIQLCVAELFSSLQSLAFSCRHGHKSNEDELDLHEKARFIQGRLHVLLDPAVSGTSELLAAVENGFGILNSSSPPTKEQIANISAVIIASCHNIVNAELDLLRNRK